MLSQQTIKFLRWSLVAIITCLLTFVSMARYLVVRPLDFVAPDASPIDAEVPFPGLLNSSRLTILFLL
jgi:hypothetical protein